VLGLITATYNSIGTLESCLASTKSIRGRIKQFVVDGSSTDGTWEYLTGYVKENPNTSIQLQNGTGLYQAINEGLETALRDSDVTHIGLLHSDDRLIAANYCEYLSEINSERLALYYSDIQFHDRDNRVVRRWNAGRYSPWRFRTGWMPPHTGMIVSKSVYDEIGLYDPKFGTAADYEWIIRVLKSERYDVRYFPKLTVSMLIGGASNTTFKARLKANAMDGAAWADESWLQAALIRVCKPMRKIGQFLVLRGPP